MYNGFLENQRGSVIASLGLGTIFFAFANRLCLLPRQVTSNRDKLLDVCDRGMLIGVTGFNRVEDDAREQAIPNLFAGGGLIEEIDGLDLLTDDDRDAGGAIDVLEMTKQWLLDQGIVFLRYLWSELVPCGESPDAECACQVVWEGDSRKATPYPDLGVADL